MRNTTSVLLLYYCTTVSAVPLTLFALYCCTVLLLYTKRSQMWGMGDAMRRRSIARIGRVLADKDPATAHLLDVGCGTGRFLTFVKVSEFISTDCRLHYINRLQTTAPVQ